MAFEVVPTAAGRLHSDQYTKIIIINTPINLRVFLYSLGVSYNLRLRKFFCSQRRAARHS